MSGYSLGIDFGTSNSSMAWRNKAGQAEVILNAEGEAKTPSLVYFGDDETLVGKPAQQLIEDAASDYARRADLFRRTIASVKRDLLFPPKIALPGGRFVSPVDVAAEVIKKLKRDAEEGHFYEEVPRAVITCPAEFDALQRKKIEEAGYLAGFREVVLLEEPVAGALAFSRLGLKVGQRVLVYDLGGGTFDLAVLEGEGDSFRVALEPRGMDRCGGDDFDLALYDYCDEIARKELGRPISLTGDLDLTFLQHCRQRKENLSFQEKGRFSNYLASENGPVQFVHTLERGTFEGLIKPQVDTTVRLTQTLVEEAGTGLDTVVLIGGSTRIRLVPARLGEVLPVKPLSFDKKDLAVALGAAYRAHDLWPDDVDEDQRLQGYRSALGKVWADREVRPMAAEWLRTIAEDRRLGAEEAAGLEQEIMGGTKEELARQTRRAEPEPGPADFVPTAHEFTDTAGEVRALAFVPDRTLVVSGGAGTIVEGWSLRTGALEGTLSGHTAPVTCVAVIPDGSLLASGGQDRSVRLWKLPEGKVFGTLDHPDWVFSVATSPDGQYLASGGADGEIRIWDLAGPGGELYSLSGHSHWVLSVAVSHDGTLLASGGADKTIRLWDLETGNTSGVLDGHAGWVRSVTFDPGGKFLASGGEDGEVRLWNPGTGELLRACAGHRGPVYCVAVSPDGRLVASGGADRKVRLWDPETGELLNVLSGHGAAVQAVAISPEGKLIASGGGDWTVRLWTREAAGEDDAGSGKVGPSSSDGTDTAGKKYREALSSYFKELNAAPDGEIRPAAWMAAARKRLIYHTEQLGLTQLQAARIEREVMGWTKEVVFGEKQQPKDQPPSKPNTLPDDDRPMDLPD